MNPGIVKTISILLILALLASCKKEEVTSIGDYTQLPAGFPLRNIPLDNFLTLDRIALGKILFYDPILSRDSTISCATCHNPILAFTDGLPKSKGIGGQELLRNAKSLANVAYHPYYLSEGGVPTLEQQVLVPIQEHPEFDNNILLIADKLQFRKDIVDLSLKAYFRYPDPYVIVRSISAFERTFISGNSAYDQYYYQNKKDALSESQIRGLELFKSERLSCSKCHGGFNFTSYDFQNNGLALEYVDNGRKRLTGKDEDNALFKVPSLRNVEITGPYMHDGSIKTLEEVIEHYNSGGKNHPNKSQIIKALHLTPQDKQDLINFLRSLTDYSFIKDKKYRK
ncbi:MAG TPA: cytochrome c peroxidase [Saprospiraceae bacterium]|nr:cytochrome c peroxidase [Saprospiraceae bacterium]